MSVAKIIRMEEVKKNNDSDSIWVVIHGWVYDLTDYLNEHPGGRDVLLEEAGRDASEAFEDIGHTSDAREIMAKYKIGELHEDDALKTEQRDGKENKRNICWLISVAFGLTVTAFSVLKLRRSR